MKNSIVSALSLLLMCSCTNDKAAVFEGSISGNAPEFVILTHGKSSLLKDTIRVQNGAFRTEIKLKAPQMQTFQIGRWGKTVYLEPGKTLSLRIDLQENGLAITATGTLALENRYLDSLNVLRAQYFQPRKYGQLQVDDAFATVDADARTVRRLFNNAAKTISLTPAFREMADAAIDYATGSIKLNLLMRPGALTPHRMAAFNNLPLEAPDLLTLPDYRTYVDTYIATLMLLNPQKWPDNDLSLDVFRTIKDDDVRSYALYSRLLLITQIIGAAQVAPFLPAFYALNTDSLYSRELRAQINAQAELLPGAPAPDFIAFNEQGNPTKLSSYQGKWVYIDFWATWCGPCRAEIAPYRKLQGAFSGRNVVFLSVSFDKNEATWKEFIKHHPPTEVHLFAPGGMESDAAKRFQIKGIPRYALITPDGKIADAHAPRPSDPEAMRLLSRLVQ